MSQNKPEVFVAVSIPTILTLLNIAGQTTKKVPENERADAIREAAQALNEARKADKISIDARRHPIMPDCQGDEL
jgi:hypothetical protein